jgi:succinate--hydroxymethylglutarate CoA-transferase
MILGDLGADVLKIEKPESGDESRKWGPPFLKNSSDSVYFLACNRNKRSVCVDLKKGRDIIYDLARECDVLMENYVPGKLDKMELGYEHIKAISPSIIYCSVTGFGSTGPYKSRAGYDVIAASMGGLLHITGEKSSPSKVGVAITDICTGLYAHGAILAALLHRHKTGHGQRIEVDLFSTQVACLINVGVNYLNANIEAGRCGTEHISIVPYASYETADGFFTIGTGSDKQFVELCKLMSLEHLGNDPKYLSNSERVRNRDELTHILKSEFAKERNAFWSEKFKSASFPFGPVNSMEAVFTDEHVKEVGMVKTLRHKEAGDVRVVGPNVVYSDSQNEAYLAPPVLGQHTEEVLRSVLKYSDEKIDKLRYEKIIQ